MDSYHAQIPALADHPPCNPINHHAGCNDLSGHHSALSNGDDHHYRTGYRLEGFKGFEIGDFTWYHWVRMLTSKIAKIMTYEPLLHSIVVSLGATMFSLVIGGLMAWMGVRTDMPGRNTIHMLATIPYIMPSWTIAMAWTVIFKNRTTGGTPGLLEFILGTPPPNWLAYGPIPIIVSSGLHYYTFFFLFVSAPLLSIDPHWKRPENWQVQDVGASCARSPSR